MTSLRDGSLVTSYFIFCSYSITVGYNYSFSFKLHIFAQLKVKEKASRTLRARKAFVIKPNTKP